MNPHAMTRLVRACRRGGTLLLVFLPVVLASCDRSAPSTGPVAVQRVTGDLAAGPGSVVATGELATAVVVLSHTASLQLFLARYGLTELEVVDIGGTTYHLVQSNTLTDPAKLVEQLEGAGGEVSLVAQNPPVAAPEFEGEPMSFDDGNGMNTPTGYQNVKIVTQIRLAEAHSQMVGGQDVRVAVLDTGIDAGHPALQGHYVLGNDYTVFPHRDSPLDVRNGLDDDGDHHIDEGFGHGTHVAGIVHFVAPQATIIAIRVLDDEGWGTAFGLACGIEDAVARGADVINLSMGLTESHPMIEEAVHYATAQGAAVVASAGNRATTTLQYPASYGNAFSVTAVTRYDRLASFSNYNTAVDVSAPGVDIVSTFPVSSEIGPYAAGDGTSMAAPFLAGVTALALSAHPGMTGVEAAQRVVVTSRNIDALNSRYAEQIGRGRVDAAAAVQDEMELPRPPAAGPVPRF